MSEAKPRQLRANARSVIISIPRADPRGTITALTPRLSQQTWTASRLDQVFRDQRIVQTEPVLEQVYACPAGRQVYRPA